MRGNFPDWLQEKLATPPEAGAGIHAWLFSVARQLHVHLSPDAIAATLQAATANCGRHVTAREIRDAVNNSHAVAWQPKPKQGAAVRGGFRRIEQRGVCRVDGSAPDSCAPERWPKKRNPAHRRSILRSLDNTREYRNLSDLWEETIRYQQDIAERTADDWLDWLFPDAEWLCLAGDHPATARTRRREKWYFGPADECGLVVPSPMTGPSGKGLDGRSSHRCLDNTGPRRWLVIEFDKLEDGKTPMPTDEQAALHCFFEMGAQAVCGWPHLRLCVHSGSKSIHGWYGPITDEEKALEMMQFAVIYGADPSMWNRCQLVRLPGGRRAAKPEPLSLPDGFTDSSQHVRQEVFYFDPHEKNGNP